MPTAPGGKSTDRSQSPATLGAVVPGQAPAPSRSPACPPSRTPLQALRCGLPGLGCGIARSLRLGPTR